MELPADVVEEILLRLPPADPVSLVRAALVCKPWCRIVCARSFRRRFMEFHRTAPLLGFLCNPLFAWFVPTSSFRPRHTGCEEEVRDCVVLDARHGLVVLHFVLGDDEVDALVIWDPTTGERWEIPVLDDCERDEWYATVLREPTADGTAFVVVRFVTKYYSYSQVQRWSLRVYSSAAACWSEPTLVPKCSVDLVPTALVGNTLYFSIDNGSRVLGFDLATSETSVVHLPPASNCAIALMEMEGGGLGFARVDMAARLLLWSMEVNPNGGVGWTRTRVIELQKLLPVDAGSIIWLPWLCAWC